MRTKHKRTVLPASFALSKRTAAARKKRGWGFFAGAITVLSFVGGSVAALLGYGAALVLNTKFAMPHEPLFASSFELIELIVAVIPQVFIGFAELDFWRELYLPILADSWPTMLGLALGWMAFAMLCLNRKRIEKLRVSGRFPKLSVLAINPDNETGKSWAWKGATYTTLMWLGAPLALLFIIMLVLTILFVLSMVPLLGMASASIYVERNVIEPAECVPLWSRNKRMAERQATLKRPETRARQKPEAYAQCVAVHLPRSDAVTGRVIFSTSSAIFLFDPATGVTTRLPVRDAVITAVDRL